VFATPFYPLPVFLDVLLFEKPYSYHHVSLFEGQGFSALAAAAARRRREEAAAADRRSRSNSPLSLSASPKLEIITGRKRCSYNNSSPFLSQSPFLSRDS
jgi:hypothetical protein